MTQEQLPVCPVATTIQLIGSKWKLLIIRELLTGTKRTGELKRSLPNISQKVLTETLKSMVQDGLVLRSESHSFPLKVEYSLSNLGQSMVSIFRALEDWGNEYIKNEG